MGDLHICEATIDSEAYVGILERHINSELHSARVTTAWLRLGLTALPAVQIYLQLKIYGPSSESRGGLAV